MAGTYRNYTLYDLVERLGYEIHESGSYIICPFCNDGRSKLRLNNEKSMWQCFKCENSGQTLHLYSKLVNGYDFPDDKEGRTRVSREFRQFMGGDTAASSPRTTTPKKREYKAVRPASDDVLHSVYSAMASLPVLRLRKEHRKALLARGLSEEVIERNEYRSIPYEPFIPDCYEEMYQQEGGEERRTSLPVNITPIQIKLGLMIAHTLVSTHHLSLERVPGFFKFGSRWCLWCPAGILIPTRNMHGQIVCWQIRVKYGKQKYFTLANQRLPGTVNEGVTRCHFPLGNAPFSKDDTTPILFTEGPLKADVACHLYGSPVIFLAIQGVKNTEDFLSQLQILKTAHGITEICNAFDMDRLTNPNVRRGAHALRHKLKCIGIQTRELYWGFDYAQRKLMTLSMVAKLRNVPVSCPRNYNVYLRLELVAEALARVRIDACTFPDPNDPGKDIHYYWEPETKGIDDYLFSRQQITNPFGDMYTTSGEELSQLFEDLDTVLSDAGSIGI